MRLGLGAGAGTELFHHRRAADHAEVAHGGQFLDLIQENVALGDRAATIMPVRPASVISVDAVRGILWSDGWRYPG